MGWLGKKRIRAEINGQEEIDRENQWNQTMFLWKDHKMDKTLAMLIKKKRVITQITNKITGRGTSLQILWMLKG